MYDPRAETYAHMPLPCTLKTVYKSKVTVKRVFEILFPIAREHRFTGVVKSPNCGTGYISMGLKTKKRECQYLSIKV